MFCEDHVSAGVCILVAKHENKKLSSFRKEKAEMARVAL